MKTFTIDTDNNISAFATPEEAAATTITPFDTFASEKELSSLIAKWPAERLVAIWNSLPGVTPVKKFKNAKIAAGKIWERIQSLGGTAKPKQEPKAKSGARVAQGAPAKATATKKPTPSKKAPTAAKAAKQAKAPGTAREGSKTAQVVELLRRKDGATLEEIMSQMGWQKHTVRGFMAGAMKKAGHTVESFKSEKGERTYRINS